MKEMKEYMLLFRFEPSNVQPTLEQIKEMEIQWGVFIGGIAQQGNLISTNQLGFEGKKINANQQIEGGFHISDGLMVAGNMVLKAESIEAASEMAKQCPILLMGGNVEVRNIMPM